MTVPAVPEPDLLPLPRTLALSLWTSSYLRGDCGPDDAVAGAHGRGHRHVDHEGVDLFDWMTSVRRLPLPAVRPVLPTPGRIAGLAGPPEAVTAALEAGQALVVTAAGLSEQTLVPETEELGARGTEGIRVRWDLIGGTARTVAPPGGDGAREAFLQALRRAARGTTRLDLVPDEPLAPSSLPASWTAIEAPRHLDRSAAHLLVLSARTLVLTEAELAADPLDGPRTGALGVQTLAARTALLRELHDAARDALVDVAALASTA